MNTTGLENLYTVSYRGVNIHAYTVVTRDHEGRRIGGVERFRFILPNGRERCTETLHGAKCIIARTLKAAPDQFEHKYTLSNKPKEANK